MSRLLVIGCGGVAQVAISKICQDSETFTEIMIASRTKSKCDDLKAKLEGKTSTIIETAALDADKVEEVIALIESYKPEAVLNVALPYQDLTIMDACLATGAHYIDTANYEAEDTEDPEWRAIYEKRCKELGFTAYFDYSWQWAYQEKFKEAGLTALLGSGFDPGVTSVFSAYALKHYFDEIHYIDILDCNGGDHGYPFATNFNPEINLREVSAPGSYWEDGKWVEVEAMSIKREYDFPQVGQKDMYLLHHEEIESLAKNIPGVKRIRFFMTFGQSYLTHMKCLENVGLLRTDAITDPILESLASRSCKPWSTHSWENQYRLYLYRCQRWCRKDHLYLQCLRPSGVLRRSWFTGNFLHNRCSCHDWNKISDGWYLETTRSL